MLRGTSQPSASPQKHWTRRRLKRIVTTIGRPYAMLRGVEVG
jgi:hypothetical protein